MKKVIIRGPVLSRSGYGEHARFMFRSLSSRPDLFDLYIIPVGWGQSSWMHADSDENKEIIKIIDKTNGVLSGQFDPNYFDVSLQVGIPNEWGKLAKYNIGVTAAVETDKASAKWIHGCNQVDRIFVTSKHAEKSLSSEWQVQNQNGSVMKLSRTTPIDVISYPAKIIEKDLDFQKSIVLDTKFNFLTIAQMGPRKNLKNSISWFLEEFKDNPEVGLVVKAHQLNNSYLDRNNLTNQFRLLKAAHPEAKCKVYFIHGNLTDEEVSSLYTHPDIHAYITATHGEGFGLPVFEAACNGLPVVAPAWSGYTDFLYADVENSVSKRVKSKPFFTKVKYDLREVEPDAIWEDIIIEGSKWCYVDGEDFRNSIRKVYETYKPKKLQAEELSSILHEKLENKVMYEKVIECVTKVLPEDMGELEDWFEQFNESVVVSE